jgi:hypothetical protein
MVDGWLKDGAVREWPGPVGTLDAATGGFAPAAAGSKRYVVAGGMARLAEHMASPVRRRSVGLQGAAGCKAVRAAGRGVAPAPPAPLSLVLVPGCLSNVQPSLPTPCPQHQGGAADARMELRRPLWVSRMSATPKGWQLTGAGASQGFFDAVVIAHNGGGGERVGGGHRPQWWGRGEGGGRSSPTMVGAGRGWGQGRGVDWGARAEHAPHAGAP